MDLPIRLIIGLGNPGPKYEVTRHNAGFWLADNLASHYMVNFNHDKPFFSMVAKARHKGDLVLIAKPETFMNRSGQAAGALMRFYRLEPQQVLVLHDELDLPCGQAKLKLGGGHAGHNGLRDIQQVLGSSNFWRMRIGIDHPRNLGLTQQVAAFVLSQPRSEELTQIESSIQRCLDVIPHMLNAEFESAVTQLHTGNK